MTVEIEKDTQALEKVKKLTDSLFAEPYKCVLHIDWDYAWPPHWIPIWRQEKTAMLESMGLSVTNIIMKPSPHRKEGLHLWIHISTARELSDDEINMLQFLCGDHHTRTWINTLRVDRGLKKWWNKLFSRHLWRKPLPEACEKCKIRQILAEMNEQQRKPKRPRRKKQ